MNLYSIPICVIWNVSTVNGIRRRTIHAWPSGRSPLDSLQNHTHQSNFQILHTSAGASNLSKVHYTQCILKISGNEEAAGGL